MDKVRFVSSGTEAVMSAVRLARGYTGRDLLVKFEGCYHGHVDSPMVSLAAVSLWNRQQPGYSKRYCYDDAHMPINDIEAVEFCFVNTVKKSLLL